MNTVVPFMELVLSYPTREKLLSECLALCALCFQHVLGTLRAGSKVRDVFAGTPHQDEVSRLLSASSVAEITQYAFSSQATAGAGQQGFWEALRRSLEVSWTPCTSLLQDSVPHDAGQPLPLLSVGGQPRFCFAHLGTSDGRGRGLPLSMTSLHNAVTTSKALLRTVTVCALAGSASSLVDRKTEALRSLLLSTRLVYPSHNAVSSSGASQSVGQRTSGSTGGGDEARVTPEGLHFCMMPMPQQWWVLMNGALNRALALTAPLEKAGVRITRPLLWQLLSVLFALDTTHYVYAFPTRENDPAGYHLLARLVEIGLVYPLLQEGCKCFVLSPFFHHAIEWRAVGPICRALMIDASPATCPTEIRREDEDTIVTESNFCLYAYTRSVDLLSILDQFAERKEVVQGFFSCYRVTRASFASALRKGITAAQILQFLSIRAHPSMKQEYGESVVVGLQGEGGRTGGPYSDAVGDRASGTGTLVVPQSFCDQLLMWESEYNRVIFRKHMVLITNISSAQKEYLIKYLSDAGEADAVVYTETGSVVVKADAYDRLIATALDGNLAR